MSLMEKVRVFAMSFLQAGAQCHWATIYSKWGVFKEKHPYNKAIYWGVTRGLQEPNSVAPLEAMAPYSLILSLPRLYRVSLLQVTRRALKGEHGSGEDVWGTKLEGQSQTMSGPCMSYQEKQTANCFQSGYWAEDDGLGEGLCRPAP